MRTLKPSDIQKKLYLVKDGKVIRSEIGDYYSNQIAKHIAENKLDETEIIKMKEIDENQLKLDVIKYLKKEYSTMLKTESGDVNLLYEPLKKFELFMLDTSEKTVFLSRTSLLPDGNDKELYYNFDIANDVYLKMIDLNSSAFNDYEEVRFIYENEAIEKKKEISKLKIKDQELFENDVKSYEILSNTTIYENYRLLCSEREKLLKENGDLSSLIKKYNEKIYSLTKKLELSLNKIEELQRPKSFKEKFKELFKNNKQIKLLSNEEGK